MISIIIPSYNHANFLEMRLESVFNQTFQDFEVILLDDASVDGSMKILKLYANHPKVSHLIVNELNSGSPFLQWKKGIDLAKGEFIWIAESDDYCELNFLEELYLKIQPSTVLIYSASYEVNETNEILGLFDWASRMDKFKWSKSHTNRGKDEIIHFLRFRNTIPNASAVIFRKKSFINIDIPESMFYCGDWYIWLQILKKGTISYINKPLNYFRKHSSTTRSFQSRRNETKRFKEYFWIVRKTCTIAELYMYGSKYDWMLDEMALKERYLGKRFFLNINMPTPLKLRKLLIWNN